MNANRVLEIAQSLGFEDVVADLQRIINRMSQQNCPLVLPLVGEFSAGKTTLINALTDSKQLETATKPTTATIYEVHFGCDRCHAVVIDEKGKRTDVENIADLKNAELADAKVVNVYDTSTKVPSSTIIVDTPGLSSPDPRHKQTLVDFMPLADGVLVVVDVNQSLTKSLTDFIQTISLSKRPIYLVLTYCDMKSDAEVESQKKYICDNTKIPLKQVCCVSAKTGNLQEIYSLLDAIQKDKDEILKQVDNQRLKNIVDLLVHRIDDLLKSAKSDSGIEEAIRQKKHELDKLNRNIDGLIEHIREDVSVCENNTIRQFEDIVFDKLDALAAGKSLDFDAEAISIINNTTSLLLNDYKVSVREILAKSAREKRSTDEAVNLRSVEDLDMSEMSVQGLNYNLNLNAMGHEYDGLIATGVKVAAVAAVVVAGAGAIGAAGEAGAAEVGTAEVVGAEFSAADTVAGVSTGVLLSNMKNNKQPQEQGEQKGILKSIIGLVTDKTMGKPQRRRAIHDYMDSSLIPSFKSGINRVSQQLVGLIGDSLHAESAQTIEEMTSALEQLQHDRKEQKSAYEQKINQFRDYKNELLTL